MKRRRCCVKSVAAGPASQTNIAPNEQSAAIALFPAVGKVAERRLAALDEIACMTEAMMALAEEGDWDALPEAQAARDAALRACFSAPLTEDDGPDCSG